MRPRKTIALTGETVRIINALMTAPVIVAQGRFRTNIPTRILA